MRLSEIMSHAGLAGYAEVGLVLFLLAFVGIALRTFARSARAELERASRLPLDEAERTAGASEEPTHD